MSKISKINIIEELSNSYNVQDMWDSFNDEEPSKKMLYIQTGVEYKIRFLGPFIKARRTYLPENSHFPRIMSVDELKSIVSGNASIYNSVISRLKEEQKKAPKTKGTNRQRLLPNDGEHDYALSDGGWGDTIIAQSFAPNRRVTPPQSPQNSYIEAQTSLKKLYESSKWQRCVMVNALVKSGNNKQPEGLKLVVLTNAMIINIKYEGNRPSDIISGLFAKDITIKKEGASPQLKYQMKVDNKSTLLNQSEINNIFSKGLVDISEAIKCTNRRSAGIMSSYFYRKSSGYKMPDEMYSTLFKELSYIDSMRGFEDAGDKLGSLPDEAFENKDKMSDSINCLELDL